MLTFDPHKRWSASLALTDFYLSDYANCSDEPECFAPFHIEDELDDFSYAKYQVGHFYVIIDFGHDFTKYQFFTSLKS